MIGQPAVEARGLSKHFGEREVLRGIDFVARHGQLHGLLGPNGAGKTTLMRTLLGLVRRDAGRLRLLGHPVESTSGPVPDGVAALIDTAAFYPYLSGRANLAVLARLDGIAARERRNAIDRALEQTDLTDHADEAVKAYSAGMRQRLGLAAALLRSPRLLLLDEPTSALDPAAARGIRQLARRLADEGTAVVWSSHDMAEVEALCSTLTVLDHGRVVFAGSVDELRMVAPASVYRLQTSDDRTAVRVATYRHGMRVTASPDGLEIAAGLEALDAFVIGLGRAGVAVRHLERRTRSLESLFLELTGQSDAEAETRAAADQHEQAVAS